MALGRSLRILAACARAGELPWALGNLGRNVLDRPRVLAPRPVRSMEESSARRINALLTCIGQSGRYLEIGVEYGRTIEAIQAELRVGVDPSPRFDTTRLPQGVTVATCSSDEYFASLAAADRFDLVFLDGLHTFEQTYRDLASAIRHSPDGIVLIDDVVPCDAAAALPDYKAAIAESKRLRLARDPLVWQGDVYKVVLAIAQFHPELDFRTISRPDKAQTVVWQRPGERFTAASRASLSQLDSVLFTDLFGGSELPQAFRPCNESAAIAAAIEGVRSRRQPTAGWTS